MKPRMKGVEGISNFLKANPMAPNSRQAMTWLMLFLSAYAPMTQRTKTQGRRMYLGMLSSFTNTRSPKNSMNNMMTEASSMAAKIP